MPRQIVSLTQADARQLGIDSTNRDKVVIFGDCPGQVMRP
jgi:hypothetical protein